MYVVTENWGVQSSWLVEAVLPGTDDEYNSQTMHSVLRYFWYGGATSNRFEATSWIVRYIL